METTAFSHVDSVSTLSWQLSWKITPLYIYVNQKIPTLFTLFIIPWPSFAFFYSHIKLLSLFLCYGIINNCTNRQYLLLLFMSSTHSEQFLSSFVKPNDNFIWSVSRWGNGGSRRKKTRKRSGGSFLVTSSEEQCRFWDFLQAFIIFIINRKICSGHIKLKLTTTEECFNGHSEDKEWLNLSIIHHHLPGSSVKCFAYLNNLILKSKPLFSPVLYMGVGGWYMITQAHGSCCFFIKSQQNCLLKMSVS